MHEIYRPALSGILKHYTESFVVKKKTCFSMALILLQKVPNSFSYLQRYFNYLGVKERM